MPQGGFHIVNAGAGTADNITLRGWQLLQQADLVIASESVRRQYATALAGKAVVDGGHGLLTDLALRRTCPTRWPRQRPRSAPWSRWQGLTAGRSGGVVHRRAS